MSPKDLPNPPSFAFDTDAFRFARERRGYPDRIFDLARRNPVVSCLVAAWRRGDCTWEAALSEMVLHLAHQNEKLLETATVAALRNPPDIVVEKSNASDSRTPS